jgi:hypothetical protein
MSSRQCAETLSPKDRLVTRPETEALPTPLDPRNPHPADFPDPKPVAKEGQGDPNATDPAPSDVTRSA